MNFVMNRERRYERGECGRAGAGRRGAARGGRRQAAVPHAHHHHPRRRHLAALHVQRQGHAAGSQVSSLLHTTHLLICSIRNTLTTFQINRLVFQSNY